MGTTHGGKVLYTKGSKAEGAGKDKPFRYRGYVYDEETQLYYLRSRYHDPEWGRFLNADSVLGSGGLLSHNLLARWGMDYPKSTGCLELDRSNDSKGAEKCLLLVE